MMAAGGSLSQQRSLKRAERHLLWLRENMPNHSITNRVERELIVQRTQLALAEGDTVANISERVGGTGSKSRSKR